MRRQLNLKALLVVLLAILVLGTGLYFLHSYQVWHNAQSLLAQAAREQEAGHTDLSLRYLDTYLRFRPRDDGARERFADILSQSSQRLGDLDRVLYDLERLLRNNPDRHDLRRKAVEVAMRLGQPDEALRHLEQLKKQFPDDAEVLEQMGQVQEKKLRFADAAKSYAAAVRKAPRKVPVHVAWAYLLQTHLDDAGRADEVIKEMRKANPTSTAALVAWARYHMAFKGSREREEAYRQVVQQASRVQDPELLLLAADMEADHKQLSAARQHLQAGLKLAPSEYRYHQALARLELQAGNRPEAIRHLQEAMKNLPGDLTAVVSVADLALDAGATEEARRLRDAIERDERSAAILNYLDGRLHMAKQEHLQALEMFQRAAERLTMVADILKQAQLLAGECHRQLGNPDQQLASCRAAIQVDPTWLPAQLGLAASLQALGRTEEAARHYTTLADRSPTARLWGARLWLIVSGSSPKKSEGLAAAANLLEGAPAPLRSSAEFRCLQVQLLLTQGKVNQACREAQEATRALPRDVAVWLARAEAVASSHNPAEVTDILDAAEKAAGRRAAIRLARLQHLHRNGKQHEVEGLLSRSEQECKAWDAEERDTWLRGVAAFRIRCGDPEGAYRSLAQLASRRPGEVGVRTQLLELLLARPDTARLDALVGELKRLEGEEGTWWRLAEAAALVLPRGIVDRSRTERARALLAEVSRRRPGWAAPLVLGGMLDEQEGNTDAATAHYQQAIELGERRPDVVRRLVGLYFHHRRYAEARTLISRVQMGPRSSGLGRLAAEASLSAREDPRQTLELAHQAVPANSRNYEDHLWLGEILWNLDRPAEAQKELHRAVELGLHHPEPWVMLIQFLATHQRREEAHKLISEAAAKLPTESAPLALAACWEAVGERERAAEQYRNALAAHPDDPALEQAVSLFHLRSGEMEQACGHLRKVLEAPGANAALVGWARRTLALALGSSGNYERSTEALALLKEGAETSSQDRRARALILARRPGGRKEAIRNLEAAFLQVPPTDAERYLLGCLYAANQDWHRAREQFLQLLTSNTSPNPGHLATFVQLLMQQGELDDAAHWLEELEKQQPKELRTAALKARLLCCRKSSQQALGLLREAARKVESDPARQVALARVLEDLGFATEAEPFYRSYAQACAGQTPAAMIPLISYLGRRNRLDEALRLCEQLQGKMREETMVPVWVACLRSGTPRAEQCRVVDGWVDAALRRQPDQPLFALARANLRDMQGRPEEAERIYREVLRHDDRNVLALNNLAALLAFRDKPDREALSFIERAIGVSGPVPGLLDTRAIVYLSQGQWEQAARDLEDVVSLEAAPASYLRLARAYLMAGDRRQAQAALRKARQSGVRLDDLHPLERPVYGEVLHQLEGG